MVKVVSRFRLKAHSDISSSCISPLTSSGQRSRASWASQPQKSATLSPQPGGKPRKFIRTRGSTGGGDISWSLCYQHTFGYIFRLDLAFLNLLKRLWYIIMILIVYVSTIVFITQGSYIGYMFRLLNSHLQAYCLQLTL